MDVKKVLVDFATVFAVTLIVAVVVTAMSNLIVHGALAIDWEAAVRSAILFGIVFSWMGTRRGKER